MLDALASDDANLRYTLAGCYIFSESRVKLPPDIMLALATDEAVSVRRAVARTNQPLTLETIQVLAKDRDPVVRNNLVLRPQELPIEVLKILACEESIQPISMNPIRYHALRRLGEMRNKAEPDEFVRNTIYAFEHGR